MCRYILLFLSPARDRKLRDYVDKTGVRPVSGMSNRPRRPYTSYDQFNDDIYDERLWVSKRYSCVAERNKKSMI